MPIISPGNQESNADGAIELRIAADIDETTGCTFSATGLPDGLEFERKKFEDDEEHTWQTGRIIGTPKRAGIYQVTVTAIDKAGTKTTASFVWTVCAMRAYRFALDLSDPQITAMQQHAGTARWAYNKALEAKVNAHRAYTERLKALLASGLTPQQAKAQMKKESAALKAQTAIWEHHRQCLTAMNLGRALPAKTPRGPQELIDDLAAIRAMVPDGVDPALLTLVGNWKGQPPTALCWARDRHEARQKWIKTHLVMARQTVTHLKQQLFDLGDTIPNMIENLANWRNTRDLPKEEGGSPWWQEVSSYVFSGGMGRADAAWSNWLKSLSGQRAGKAVGYPRFKKRGQCADSFPLFHDVTNPSIRIEGYRHLRLPNIGEVRVHNSGHRSGTRNRVTATNAKGVKRTVSGQSKGRLGSTKRLVRMIERGDAIVQSVTVVRGGHRWYANVLVKLTPEAMRQREMVARAHQKVSKKRAQGRGNVGVEWGVRTLATLSNGESFANPKPGKKNQRRLRVASQKVSRKPHKRGQPISANGGDPPARQGPPRDRRDAQGQPPPDLRRDLARLPRRRRTGPGREVHDQVSEGHGRKARQAREGQVDLQPRGPGRGAGHAAKPDQLQDNPVRREIRGRPEGPAVQPNLLSVWVARSKHPPDADDLPVRKRRVRQENRPRGQRRTQHPQLSISRGLRQWGHVKRLRRWHRTPGQPRAAVAKTGRPRAPSPTGGWTRGGSFRGSDSPAFSHPGLIEKSTVDAHTRRSHSVRPAGVWNGRTLHRW